MKNLIDEKPTDKLEGRTLYSTTFVDDKDLHNKRVLDIGYGSGWFELNAVKRGTKHIIGVKLDDRDLDIDRNDLSDERIKFQQGDPLELPFDHAHFDTVVSWEVIEHIPGGTEPKMLSEVFRILKDKGVFYLSTPYKNFFSCVFDPAWYLTGHRHYKKNTLISLFERAGFECEKLTIRGWLVGNHWDKQ